MLCHSDVRRNVQLRNAEPTCSDSARSTPLKSHSVNTTRSVRSRLRSSSRKSWLSELAVDPDGLGLGHAISRAPTEHVQRVLGDRDQRGRRRVPVARIDGDDRNLVATAPAPCAPRAAGYLGASSNSLTATRNGMLRASKKSTAAKLSSSRRHVDEDDRADRTADQVVPHEPEPSLARGAEQVQHQVLGQGDATEVHRHRGGASCAEWRPDRRALPTRWSPGPRYAAA